MDPTTGATISVLSSLGPFSWLFAILLIILIIGVPSLVKFWNWSKETSAQGMLYQQLSEMVQKQRQELDTMYTQRTEMQSQIFELKYKVDNLESCEKTVDILKNKLDEKDKIIAERDIRIANLLEELLKMKDRVHNLELRLKSDEEKFLNQNNSNV